MKKLEVDDLCVGKLVVVLKRQGTTHIVQQGFSDVILKLPAQSGGSVLEIMAVDLPYIVVAPIPYYNQAHPMDTREVELGAIGPDYVKALHPNFDIAKHYVKTDIE